jgi:hypothetical protein
MEAITGAGAEREFVLTPVGNVMPVHWTLLAWIAYSGGAVVSLSVINDIIVIVRQPAYFHDEHGYEYACTGMVNRWHKIILSGKSILYFVNHV